MVHPASLGRSGQLGYTGLAARAMATAPAPEEGMAMLVPVGGGLRHRLADFRPGREAAALERQGAQDLPPRFKQVEIRGVLGLEDKLPAQVRDREEEHVG